MKITITSQDLDKAVSGRWECSNCLIAQAYVRETGGQVIDCYYDGAFVIEGEETVVHYKHRPEGLDKWHGPVATLMRNFDSAWNHGFWDARAIEEVRHMLPMEFEATKVGEEKIEQTPYHTMKVMRSQDYAEFTKLKEQQGNH